MARRSGALLGPLLLLLLSTHAQSSSAPSSEDQQVLQLVNNYRTQVVGIPALSSNNAAACVGRQMAQKFVGTPCNNATGADTSFGQSPEFSDLPDLLAACHVALVNTTMGYIAVDCVPGTADSSDAPSIAAQNITHSQLYQEKLNDTTFTSAGVGSDGVWYALILATNSPDGSYGETPGLDNNGAFQQPRVQLPLILSFAFVILTFYGTAIW